MSPTAISGRRSTSEIKRHKILWRWVRGHTGDKWNERADELASAAIPRAPLPVDDPKAVHLFTAVAHSGKQDAGAWAVLLRFRGEERELSGRQAGASANRMHITGAGMGLAELNRRVKVHLYTASDYLKDGATTWIKGWQARNWTTRDGKPVANRELWQRLDDPPGSARCPLARGLAREPPGGDGARQGDGEGRPCRPEAAGR